MTPIGIIGAGMAGLGVCAPVGRCDRLGQAFGKVTRAAAHRWRYARITRAPDLPFLRSADATLYRATVPCALPRLTTPKDQPDAQ